MRSWDIEKCHLVESKSNSTTEYNIEHVENLIHDDSQLCEVIDKT